MSIPDAAELVKICFACSFSWPEAKKNQIRFWHLFDTISVQLATLLRNNFLKNLNVGRKYKFSTNTFSVYFPQTTNLVLPRSHWFLVPGALFSFLPEPVLLFVPNVSANKSMCLLKKIPPKQWQSRTHYVLPYGFQCCCQKKPAITFSTRARNHVFRALVNYHKGPLTSVQI